MSKPDLISDKSLTPEETKTLLEYAEIAQAVYDPTETGKGNWRRVSDEKLTEMKIDPTLLNDKSKSLFDKNTNFKAGIYERSCGEVVLAFAGTETTKDWYHNLKQGVGSNSKQYQ